MRVVVVIYPVPAQSVFCVVCCFLFFLLRGIHQIVFCTPLLLVPGTIPKSFDLQIGAFSFGETPFLSFLPTKPKDILSKKKKKRDVETSLSLFLSFVTHKTRFAVRVHLFITRKNGDVQRIYRATELLDQEKRVYGTLFYSGSNKSQLFVSSTQSIFCLR